ncbi:hypothetical protein Agub_g10375, partial [Astrephomene gubernaculifera]
MTSLLKNVLVTGGSGYLGQFLVHALAKEYKVHYTYGTHPLWSAPEGAIAHKVDLVTGEGLREAFQQATFHAVVNCAAMSQPGACEASPEAARSVNVPIHLVDCLLHQEERGGGPAVLVHISTDQVYDGSKAHWKEDDPCTPVNVYGRTKLEAEQLLLARLPEPYPLLILRSSIIYGPPPPETVHRTLFLQFVAAAVQGDKPTTFFSDEWRNPVYVRDLQRLVLLAVRRCTDTDVGAAGAAAGAAAVDALQEEVPGTSHSCAGAAESRSAVQGATGPEAAEQQQPQQDGQQEGRLLWRHRVFNAGGPERLSRVDMARQVADCLGCGYNSIVAVPSSSVSRSAASPPDISMDVTRLAADLGFRMTPFREALQEIFRSSDL